MGKDLEKIYKDIALIYINKHRDSGIDFIKSFIFFVGMSILNHKFRKDVTLNFYKYYSKYSKINLTNYESELLLHIINTIEYEDLNKFEIGKIYEEILTKNERKTLGQVYTPKEIIDEIIDKIITDELIINNPYIKILDPACGGGYFLSAMFMKVKQILLINKNNIIYKYPSMKNEYDNIDKFILNNNIWGVDIDDFALFMSSISLLLKSSIYTKLNLINTDILFDNNINLKFDIVIGNPPYIGHKKLNKDYKVKLKNNYNVVYLDKSDISYCFFYKGYELLKDNGKLTFITSRYFIESPSAIGLRNFINNNFFIEYIKDYYGKKAFKGVGISPVVINLIKSKESNEKIEIQRFNYKLINGFETYNVDQNKLESNGWILLNDERKQLFNKLNNSGEHSIGEVCNINQGIITGCDKAFIVSKEEISKEKLEDNIIKPWAKNSNINKYQNIFISKYILYTDEICNTYEYKNTINHIKEYKDKLENRRECKNNIRKWYQLQWGRKLEIFNSPKIMYPYKSSKSNFTIDYNNIICSADVYIMNLKKSFNKQISLEYLLGFLNSSLFEFYFKSQGKKVGDALYEYYPNKIVNMKIKLTRDESIVVNSVRKIIKYNNIKNINKSDKLNIKDEERKINKFFYKMYKLNDDEIKTIEDNI